MSDDLRAVLATLARRKQRLARIAAMIEAYRNGSPS